MSSPRTICACVLAAALSLCGALTVATNAAAQDAHDMLSASAQVASARVASARIASAGGAPEDASSADVDPAGTTVPRDERSAAAEVAAADPTLTGPPPRNPYRFAPPPTDPMIPTDSYSEEAAQQSAAVGAQDEERIPEIISAAQGLYVEFGRGVRLQDDADDFSLTLRGRVQGRAYVRSGRGEEPTDISFTMRRARLVFLGELPGYDLELYLQIGFGAQDFEPGRAPVPVRDAVITWSGSRDMSVRIGQMKVPFNRERIISATTLQMVDRSLANFEMNLDRDIGMQIFSNDFLGLERLHYGLGIYGGAGRNRLNLGTGLLYIGRLQYHSVGSFEDTLFEADLSRSRRVRYSFGVAAGYNQRADRALSTVGPDLEFGTFDFIHLAADALIKWRGWSLQAEWMYRGTPNPLLLGERDGELVEELAYVGIGYMVQLGYLWDNGIELSGRWSEILPLANQRSSMERLAEANVGLGYYMNAHNLKLQTDYGIRFGRELVSSLHELRVQLQYSF